MNYEKIYYIFIFIVLISMVFPQISVRGGMGINFISTPSLKDYLNVSQFAPPDNQWLPLIQL